MAKSIKALGKLLVAPDAIKRAIESDRDVNAHLCFMEGKLGANPAKYLARYGVRVVAEEQEGKVVSLKLMAPATRMAAFYQGVVDATSVAIVAKTKKGPVVQGKAYFTPKSFKPVAMLQNILDESKDRKKTWRQMENVSAEYRVRNVIDEIVAEAA